MPNTERNSKKHWVHVAVGVIYDDLGRVLIAFRGKAQHQGGLWEFPGGKVERGETCQEALARELNEELGIDASCFEPLINIRHDYSDKSVILDVWNITRFQGRPFGREGQEVKWVCVRDLSQYAFPVANIPIIKAVTLPSLVAVTGVFLNERDFIFRVARAIDRGAGLIQLRPPSEASLDQSLLNQLSDLCLSRKVKLVLNSSYSFCDYSASIGLHLRSKDLMRLTGRPVDASILLGASCHNVAEVKKAEALGVDYIFLSPVTATKTHPEAEPLGWDCFRGLVSSAVMPVYALGGLSGGDVSRARRVGAQGVASIGAVWD